MSSVEALAQALGRAALPTAKHVFLQRDDVGLLNLARRFDAQAAQGQKIGLLEGAVVVIKGNIDILGMTTSAGSKSFDPAPASLSAPLVSNLVNAGALPMGHANLSEFAFSGLGLNPNFGTPLNALDHSVVPGGSSSGCATAVALGIADLAIGSDTSGSTRVPAAYQGIYGYRPSMRRYDDAGILPLAPSLDTPGPMARDFAGITLLDAVMRKLAPPTDGARADRIIVPDAESLGHMSSDMAQLLEIAANELAARGWVVDTVPVPVLSNVAATFEKLGTLVAAEAPDQLAQYTMLDNPAIDPNVRRRLAQALPGDPVKVEALRQTRKDLQEEMRGFLGNSLLLMPTVPGPPPSIASVQAPDRFAEANARALSLTMPTAFLDMPSLAMPVSGRVPGQSLSLCGVPGSDDRLLEAAKEIALTLLTLNAEAFHD
ncbi:amidase family protein [uncultured Ruegeria sp.]|uniref:amidase n=1 Tax=uncultured Ruegeria sp. TaxID=259304 RepID=UPI002639D930|nr:amidase family protein [uncultured Ruegeria sp.]